MIRWLHISDLHLNDDNFSSAMLRDDLPSFLKQRIKKCDYVFCTGDIRSANRLPNTFTESMADYLKEICDAVKVPVERLFIVPGNHDVDIYAEGREEAIRNIISDKGYYKPQYGHVNLEDLECIQRGKEDFVNFLSKIYDAERCGLYKDSNAPHFCIETTYFNVLHVDTTLVYSQNGKATDLLVGLEKLYSVVSKMNRQKPTILITHYPFTSLLQDERKLLAVVLQKSDVRLWLAGHEHDHNLQKIKYLNSLQAGELHYEDNANATILTGEYDPLTGQCSVRAYTWFEEGWAEYPIVDLDGDQLDVYKFQLGQQSRAEKEMIDMATCKNANSHFYYRMPAKVEQHLIPKIHSCCGINDNLDILLAKTWGTDSPHLALLADGGMGKTTMLLDYCKKAETPVLYVPAEQLAGIDMGIVQYCAHCTCGGNIELFEKCLSAKSRKPVLTMLVDGMNEVDGTSERKFIKEIQRLGLSDGLQMVISSRSDFTVRYSLPTFTRADVCALSEDDIKVMFSEEEWNGIVKSENLKRLLGNPMMVTIYKEICSVVDDYRNVSFLSWKFPITCNADLFHNYYVAQQALMMLRGQVEANKMLLSQICIDEILPSVANCEVVYSLTCFSCKAIYNGKDLWRHPIDGHNISALNRYEEKKFDNSRGEIDKTGNDSFAVVSYADGRLVSLHGDDVANVIARGKPRLKDATISGDGSKAVTLSYEVFAGRRRVQLWDLDHGMKTEELTCPGCVDDIHLSENGNWMLGRISRQATWVYDVRRHREQMLEENFLSSNKGKIFCKDDCVVRKQNGKVFLYNLQIGKSTPMNCPVADPSLICILGDNSVAAVDEAGYTAKMRSFRDGSLLTFHGKYSAIESIALFKEQPFIAVAMADGRLDIYHTGNGAVLRHLPAKNSIVTTHPQKTIIAESDGRRMLKTHYYFETCINGKKRGWWKEHLYSGPRSMIDGDILDIGFNLHNSQFVAVLSNGRIVFCSDDWTDYKYSFNIITAFDVSAYDFSEVMCSDELTDVLRRNRALA